MPSSLLRQLQGYGLTTAHILYRLPDHPALLQSFVWQDYDLAPKYPTLYKFLGFWSDHLDGRLHSVLIASRKLILPAEWRTTDAWLTVQ